jgi:hypothetical protein
MITAPKRFFFYDSDIVKALPNDIEGEVFEENLFHKRGPPVVFNKTLLDFVYPLLDVCPAIEPDGSEIDPQTVSMQWFPFLLA